MNFRNLILGILILALLVVPVAATTYTDAIGFRWNTSDPSPTLTRVWANGTVANVDGAYFNDHTIWGNIKKVLVNSSTGEVTYGTNNRGDGLDLNGTLRNQVMVEYPMFYTFESYNAPFLTYIVSPTQYNASFVVHPMFYQRGDGTPAAHYYVGAYEMQNETIGGVNYGTSYTGKAPLVSQTIGQMRTVAEANGPRWGLVNVWTSKGLNELLYIETGTLNSQVAWSKSRGVVDGTWTGVWNGKIAGADSADTNTFAVNATGGGTGTNGLTPVVWRALQDWWGNDWEFWDGQNSYTSGGNSIYRNINRTGLNLTGGQTKFQDLLIAGDYETSTTATIADGYQTSVATGAADRLLMIPTGTGGSETTYLADYFYYPRSTNAAAPNILLTGGSWHNAGHAGASAWHLASDASTSDANLGVRLEFRPPPPPFAITADFTASNTSGIQPLLVQFTDTSTTTDATIDSWAWDFGDGNTSALQSPAHVYEIPGTYSANLTITNTSYSLVSTKLVTITVYKQPVADFASFNNAGTATFTTYFYDTSYNLNPGPYTYYWDMGDGNTSTEQAFYYNYNLTGKFDVKHSITDSITTTWKNVTEAINVGTPTPPVVEPVASYYGGPQLGNPPLKVFFTDVSSNTPTGWFWEFGDGTNASTQNPEHWFNLSGLYRVNLTATNTAGSNKTSQSNFVIVY